MTGFPSIVETYLADLRRIRASGEGTAETSSYTPLENLLNSVGAGLKPKVFCVGQLRDQGAGHPDFGLYAAKLVQRGGQPQGDQPPEHGVVEVKSANDDAWLTAESAQVSRYWGRYRLVLVTNYRDFLLVGEDAEDFNRQLQKPRAFAHRMGVGLGEHLRRVLSKRARQAVLRAPAYREANAGASHMEWPRISLPHWSAPSARTVNGQDNVAGNAEVESETLATAAARARKLAALHESETPFLGVTSG